MSRDILLIAADRWSRALILAELQEAGHDVMAAPGLHYAVSVIMKGLIEPSLVLLDVHDDDYATPERVSRFMEFVPGAAFVLIVPVFQRASWKSLEEKGARVLSRPIRVGDVVELAARTLAEQEKARGERV
ncbi:MAG: hypothetical protein GXP42_09140 [Chloroflexi bacterium]|nr:hypothetical protein [Chloroflexota bacterium]